MKQLTTTTSIVLSLVLLVFCFGHAQLKISRTPSWVIEQSYNQNPDVDNNEISYGLLTLLSDEQIHIPKEERFYRIVQKITDNVGVQDGSSISINYDPSYQQLFLHNITVHRNGSTIDKLNINDFQLIRQESNSESYIYDGSLNAIANLADIRNGDILDVSYTVKGFNPIHGAHFSGGTTLNDFQKVGKINFYLISKTPLQYKVLNTEHEPEIGNFHGLTTYTWTTTLADPPEFEDNSPAWYLPYQNVFVTDYNSWETVVDWAIEVYQDDTIPSAELQAKIEQIQNNFEDEGLRIAATLKFVQNEIRYLGLESGIGAYQPFAPSKVLEQRFGDCKDKSWLMVTMLRQMGIKAYPVLVNSVYGESLHQFLPSPKIFDHVVVKVEDRSNEIYYYDPTISNQFGTYKSVAFPDYGKGLVIKEGVTGLEDIPNTSENLVEVFDTYDLPEVGGPGTLNVMTVYHQSEADAMRRRFKSSSLSSVSKDFKSYYDNWFDGVEVVKDPIIDDDSISNRLVVEESYKIENIWQPMITDKSKLMVEFVPYSVLDVFLSPENKIRQTPFALYYPTHKKHNITVKLPTRWGLTKDAQTISSKSFEFSRTTKMNTTRDILYLNYDYENKSSVVNPEDFKEYYDKIKELEQNIAYHIYIPKSEANSGTSSNRLDIETIGSSVANMVFWIFGIVGVVVIGLVIFVIANNRK